MKTFAKHRLIEITIIIILAILLIIISNKKIYEVRLAETSIGYTDNTEHIDEIQKQLISEVASTYNLETISPEKSFTYVQTNKRGKSVTSDDLLSAKIRKHQSYSLDGFALLINGKNFANSARRSNLETIISNVKTHFMGEFDAPEQVVFEETLEIQPVKLNLNELSTKTELLALNELLINGINTTDKYIVQKGDTASAIAKKHNMELFELEEANQDINLSKLKIGQILNISKPEKVLHLKK
ncbi:MAG: LysM peptidoglycan-binding domain-containing protein [Tissierellales bacterium]|jgi:LysM repeat protein|nr:LysM peptidoglycan-binding domain-containing protein [Tissierellales bacterium]